NQRQRIHQSPLLARAAARVAPRDASRGPRPTTRIQAVRRGGPSLDCGTIRDEMTIVKIAWSGPAPDARLLRSLKARDVVLARQGAPAAVVATSRDRLGAVPALPFIWLPPSPVAPERVREAVLRGAHDVVARSQPDLLASRLLELGQSEEPPPAAPEFV